MASSAPDQSFRSAQDYQSALLRLMGQLGEAHTSDVIAEFEHRFKSRIPSEHQLVNASGLRKWDTYVRFARQALVTAGLMGSSGRGIWTITPAGREWLKTHTEDDRMELVGLTRQAQAPDMHPTATIQQRVSSRPQSLQVSTDYYPALLWVMGNVGQARADEAIRFFEQRLGDLILPEHREPNKSGSIKWEHYVRWARQALVNTDLMGSPGRGVWAITPEGEAWLQTYPDGGKEPLMQRLREQRATQSTSAPTSKTYTATLNGQTFTFTTADVLSKIRSALAEGVPQEARRFKAWHIVVDEQLLSVKWVIMLVTGLTPEQFQSQQARRILRALGLEPQSTRKGSLPIAQPASPGAAKISREAFFAAVLGGLQDRLPSGVKPKAVPLERNFRELVTTVSRVRYILRLGYDYAEIGLHLIGPEERNLQLLDQLRLHLDAISAELHESVRAEPWRQRWARVYILRSAPALTDDTAQSYAEDWLRFITITLPFLEEAARSLGVRGKTHRATPGEKTEALGKAVEILNQKVTAIRAYLNGNPTAAPSDEALCDWVRFCYDFEFFDEGAQLFTLIRPNEVNAWLYERTKKFARICELRVGDQRGHP